MKLSLNWLNSLVDISDLSTEEIEEELGCGKENVKRALILLHNFQ